MTDDEHFEPCNRFGLAIARRPIVPPTVTDLTLTFTDRDGSRTTITLTRASLDMEPRHDRVDIAIRGFFPGFTITTGQEPAP